MRRLFLLAALTAAPALHAQKVALRPFPADGTFRSEQVADVSMAMHVVTPDSSITDGMGPTTQQMTMRQIVNATLGIEAGDSATSFRVHFDRIRLNMEGAGQSMNVDTDQPGDESIASIPGFGTLIDSMLVFRVEGDSVRLVHEQDAASVSSGNPADAMGAIMRAALGRQLFDQILITPQTYLPVDPVGVGDRWEIATTLPISGTMLMDVAGTFTVRSVEGSRVTFGGPVTLSGEAAGAGTPVAVQMTGEGEVLVTYDAATGEEETHSDLAFRGQADMQSGSMVMQMETKIQHTHTLTRE